MIEKILKGTFKILVYFLFLLMLRHLETDIQRIIINK